MKLAVIPARGGSKRIPRKNIKNFCGKPIIGWSIEAALQSRCFDRVIVSTDDEEIADIAKKFGAEAPFVRPAELADDYTGTIPVINHAVKWAEEKAGAVEYACCIYATAPFVTAKDIMRGMELIISEDVEYVFSVTHFPYPIQRAIRINESGYVEMINPEYYHRRSQDLTESFHDAGQFYWGKKSAWLNQRPFFTSKSLPLILPPYRVVDIDTMEDWKRAKVMFLALQEDKNDQ